MSLGHLCRAAVIYCAVSLALLAFNTQAEYKPNPYGEHDGTHGWGTHGYFRLGHGVSESDEQACYRLPGAGGKYRLGNECEISIELVGYYHYKQYKADNAPFFHVEARTRFRGAYSKKVDYDDTLEAYVEMGNFDQLQSFKSTKFWLGRRNYDRHFIYINDYYYLNLIGDGIGIRDVPLGNSRFAYAYMQDRLKPRHPQYDFSDRVTLQSHDFRLYDIASNYQGRILLFWQYARINAQAQQLTPHRDTQPVQQRFSSNEQGWATGLVHHQQQVLGGYNKFSIQYGQGAAFHAGASTFASARDLGHLMVEDLDLDKAHTFRVTNHHLYDGYRWAMMTGVVYERRKTAQLSQGKQTWWSFGVRPMYFINDHLRLMTEFGYDRVTQHNRRQPAGSLRKLTLAGEIAQQRGFWTRPALRIYITYAEWSDSLKGRVGIPTYADKTAGWSSGVQLESTW